MNRRILWCLLGVWAACASNVLAQSGTVRGDRFTLNSGCTMRSGSGSPEGVVTATRCDTWLQTDTGQVFEKITSSGNTGWRPLLGATAATCASYPGCAAADLSMDMATFTQRLRTDPAWSFQQFVSNGTSSQAGAHLNSFNGSGWAPMALSGAPVQVMGGGFYVGTGTISDPGAGNAGIGGYIGLPGWVSQTTGWRIDNLGAGDFQYISTNELVAKKFIADLEQALAGGQIISKSVAQVGAVFTVPAAGSISTLIVKDLPSAPDMAVFEAGDYIRVRTFSRAGGGLSITDAWGTVTGWTDLADGLQSWTFTRLFNNAGAMTGGTSIPIDSIVLDYGTSGNGFYEVNAIDGTRAVNSPYAQIVTWAGDSPIGSNQTLRVRMGNLRGVTGLTEYGIIAGTYAAQDGQYFRASNQAFELHGIDMSLWNNGTRTLWMEHTAPIFSMGNPAPTTFSAGVGCWQGMDGGVFKWRCGDPSGMTQYIGWNGTQLTVAGNIVVTGTSIDASSVGGVSAARINSGVDTALKGLDLNGNPLLPSLATPSGSGFFLGSNHLGYYTGGAWTTFMCGVGAADCTAGDFFLGGVAGALVWHNGTLTIAGTLSGNGSGITSISGGNIQTGTISATAIATHSLTATQIAAGAITATEIQARSLTADRIVSGAITANEIAGTTITADKLAAHTITGNEIAANSITAYNIAAGTITADQLSANAIDGKTITGVLINAAAGFNGYGVGAQWADFLHLTVTAEVHFYSASLYVEGFAGGGNRTVCVNNAGQLYPNTGACP
jgi:hypothetical protein